MELFTLDNLFTLLMLTLLQAVLGFDNLLYISLESQRAPEGSRAKVRRLGIAIAIILRIVLLFALMRMINYFQDPVLQFDIAGVIKANMNLHAIIVLIGGAFILYTATKEVWHMMSLEEMAGEDRASKSAASVIAWIVLVNLIFSFDSILSAMALTKVFAVMATAIVISGVLMIYLADTVSTFLQKNRMYEVLGLFILFIVGIMLLTEGGHLGHLVLFGHEITPMTKTTFYFVIAVLVLIDIVQGRYQRKLLRRREAIREKAGLGKPAT
ncbi:MAG: tellurium resistance protein TerC [Pseudomonadota bacterium]